MFSGNLGSRLYEGPRALTREPHVPLSKRDEKSGSTLVFSDLQALGGQPFGSHVNGTIGSEQSVHLRAVNFLSDHHFLTSTEFRPENPELLDVMLTKGHIQFESGAIPR